MLCCASSLESCSQIFQYQQLDQKRLVYILHHFLAHFCDWGLRGLIAPSKALDLSKILLFIYHVCRLQNLEVVVVVGGVDVSGVAVVAVIVAVKTQQRQRG